MIHVNDLEKRFGDVPALMDVNFEVQAGEFLGLLGRNGAGKTTMVRILTGQLSPTRGDVLIQGLKVTDRPIELRKLIGVMPEPSALLDGLTGNQYLHFVGQIHGLELGTLRERIRELGDLLEMDFHQPVRIADYSYGMKKKVALSASLLHAPSLLFLDEPFEGLDPVTSTTLQGLLVSLHGHGTTILMTSHMLGMAERLCTRFLIIDKGRKVADGSNQDLLSGAEDLEGLFLRIVGKSKAGALSWM